MQKSKINNLKNELQLIAKTAIKSTNQDKFMQDNQIPKWPKVHNVQGSILFVDIRNSTDMLSENGKKDMAKIYKMFARIVETAVNDYGGKVEQLMGDGVLCTFVGNKSGHNAVSATISINTYLANTYNPIVEDDWKLECGYGIRTGHVYACRIDFNGKESVVYPSTITSYASKFCGMAKGGQVVFDNPTKQNMGANISNGVHSFSTELINNCWCKSNYIWEIE